MARMTCGLAALVPLIAAAQDRAELDRSRIVGNRELPKVLHIVPWKKPLPGDLAGRPPASVIDELLAPVDREVHRRQVEYHARFVPAAAAATPPSATAAPAAPVPAAVTVSPTARPAAPPPSGSPSTRP